LAAIKAHSLELFPFECCGLIIKDDNYNFKVFRAKNVSTRDKKHSFEIDPMSILEAENLGNIVGCYHSHNCPESETIFSETDLRNISLHKIFSVVYNVANDQFYVLNDADKAKYIGTKFEFGLNDCYSLVRKYFKEELNLELRNYFRDSRWYKTNPAIWMENVSTENFSIVFSDNIFDVSNLKPHDVLLMKGRNIKYPSHAAIHIGSGFILHHPYGKLSTIEFLTRELINDTMFVARHNSLL